MKKSNKKEQPEVKKKMTLKEVKENLPLLKMRVENLLNTALTEQANGKSS